MAVSYTQLPNYTQFVQSYFVDQELLDTQNVGTVLVQTAEEQNGTDTTNNDNNNNNINNVTGYSG